MHEQEVFLAVLEEAEIAEGVALLRRHLQAPRRRHGAGRGRDIGLDAVQCVDGDALAFAQTMHELAVIDRATAKGRFRHVGLPAEIRNLAENLVVLHAAWGLWDRRWAAGRGWAVLPLPAHRR